MNDYYVYIITNFTRSTLYIGVTNDLERRMHEHKNQVNKGFSEKYKLTDLVYYEHSNDVHDAITREKQLKRWKRSWKERIINEFNSDWLDLSKEWNS